MGDFLLTDDEAVRRMIEKRATLFSIVGLLQICSINHFVRYFQWNNVNFYVVCAYCHIGIDLHLNYCVF